MDGPITEAEKLRRRAERAEAAHSDVSMLLDACRINREIAEIVVERIAEERNAALERVAELEDGVHIASRPGISGGSPLLMEGIGVRVIDLIGRLEAGESVAEAAHDFDVSPESVDLLCRIAEACRLEEGAVGGRR